MSSIVWRKRYVMSGAAYHDFSCVSCIAAILIHARLVAFHFLNRSQNYTNSFTECFKDDFFGKKSARSEKISYLCSFGRGICWNHG